MPATKNNISLLARHFPSILVLSGALIFGTAYFVYFKKEVMSLRPGGKYDVGIRQAELSSRVEELKKLKSAITALNSISSVDREKIDIFLPAAAEEPTLFTAIAGIARESGLTLLSIDAATSGALKGNYPQGLKTVDLTFGVGGGNYTRLKTFLESLESNLRLLDIQSFAYSPQGSAYSIRARAYFLE